MNLSLLVLTTAMLGTVTPDPLLMIVVLFHRRVMTDLQSLLNVLSDKVRIDVNRLLPQATNLSKRCLQTTLERPRLETSRQGHLLLLIDLLPHRLIHGLLHLLPLGLRPGL